MGIKVEDLFPGLGMINGKGWAGDMFGKKSKMEEEQAAQAKAVADQKAAQEQAAAQANASQWANRPAMKKGGMVKSSSASRRADGMASKGKTRGKFC
jgi:hypothetical protein